MVPIASEETASLARILGSYQPRATISRIAGLFTAPHLHANTIRLEMLAHLAVMSCAGTKKPGYTELGRWLNHHLGRTDIPRLEDPVEDVFVANVETPEGNRRIFTGIWEANDYFLQVVIDTLRQNVPEKAQALLRPAFALLRLSDAVVGRVGLQRWHIEHSTPKGHVPVAPMTKVEARAAAVTFTAEDLANIGIAREELTPFIFQDADKQNLMTEATGHSSLEARPLMDFGDCLVLALPNAISPAIRRYILKHLRRLGLLESFSDALGRRQAQEVQSDGLREFKGEAIPLHPPRPDNGNIPSLDAWLMKYDTNRFLYVVLLHDRLDWLEQQGLSSFMQYPKSVWEGFEKYLNRVTEFCRDSPDFLEGEVLIVMGGLGRGFMLGFKNWPDRWRLSVLRISDFLMLSGDMDGPVKRYLKLIRQKEWLEDEGVEFHNSNGDFNLYGYWRRENYHLLPLNLPVNNQVGIGLLNDFVLPVRKELRALRDLHVIQTVSGSFVQCMRFGQDSYFTSMQKRPIYASLPHVSAGTLAGAVETPRGASWLVMEPWEYNDEARNLLYQLWSGFIGLYDRAVEQTEQLLSNLAAGPIEIRLDFQSVSILDGVDEFVDAGDAGHPEIQFDFGKQVARIVFPANFLGHFLRPENTGERLVLQSITRGLIGLHTSQAGVLEDAIDAILNSVIDNDGLRVLHLFHTYLPIEHLLSTQAKKVRFLALEDLAFAKLRLSEGCTAVKPEAVLSTKAECRKFLNAVVDKVWGQLRDELRQLDRVSVIYRALELHEAVIHDRSHWQRTAQAILALYASSDDPYAVARGRESDRSLIGLCARTLIEMAICECPAMDGETVSQWKMDELLAKVALLIEAATDSDAINGELIAPRVTLHMNGEYSIDRSFHDSVIHPFRANYFHEEFKGAARDYSKFYDLERPGGRTPAEDVFGADYVQVFNAEFGLTPDEAVEAWAGLMDLAVEVGKVVVQTTVGAIRQQMIEVRGLSQEACDAFLVTFGLLHRPSWEKVPDGFKNKDINPWRYRRRLSVVVRPILLFGKQDKDIALYGAGVLMQGIGYLFERIQRGQFPTEFFASKAMRQYIGRVNDARGRAFAESVAEEFRKHGWQARTEVQMTELGANAKFGDVDVLAWKPDGQVVLLECKRLQLARTIAEIAEICRRFRGEATDELGKHVRRVTWIKQNPACLTRIVGYGPQVRDIDAWLVTNTDVPIMYLGSLPITADRVVPFRQMATLFS